MKKSLIGTLALGLIIGTGALTVKSFANERTVDTQLFVNKTKGFLNEKRKRIKISHISLPFLVLSKKVLKNYCPNFFKYAHLRLC